MFNHPSDARTNSRNMILEDFSKHNPQYAQRLLDIYGEANDLPKGWEQTSSWGIITLAGLDAFCKHLQATFAQNTAKTYAKMFRAAMNLYRDRYDFPNGYEKILALKSEAVVSTWLTDADIEAIVGYDPNTQNDALVRDQFLLGCLTGSRWSDYTRFTPQNIVGGHLVYISKKTGIRSEIPCSPAVERILRDGEFTRTLSAMTFNRVLKRICKDCGITQQVQVHNGGETKEGEKWQFVSSHTARRSFATNLYLRCHDIFMVSRYMGHSSVDMTARYILSIGDAPEEVKQYFEQFK